MTDTTRIARALISVSDKTGIADFARRLHEAGVELLSTGGTARLLSQAGLPVTEVSDHTGFPEVMGGRIKTLHPKIHGGILARRGMDDAVMSEQGIAPIDLVVVNLYPFEETVAGDASLEEAIENIDIGGPAMLRAAAKNHQWVTVCVDSADYDDVAGAAEAGGVPLTLRRRLATKAFAHSARYDGMIANYLGSESSALFPEILNLQFPRRKQLRYGENPHQRAAFYTEHRQEKGVIASAQLIQGKAMSFNNIADADAALECVKTFPECACVIVKHANPCGVAIADSPAAAYASAFATDRTSAFGGIIAFNRPLDEATARAIIDQQFVEVIVAPEVTQPARDALTRKSAVRVLETGPWPEAIATRLDLRRVAGGLLVQEADQADVDTDRVRYVTRRHPAAAELGDLIFAWRVARFVKSNAIVFAREGQTLGIGAGQMSRVDATRMAALKARDAGLDLAGSALASDAFFPFRDGLDEAVKAGARAVIQPGGSRRDDEVIDAADEQDVAMIFTDIRHFRH